MIEAVTFDFWETLVSERRARMRDLQIDGWLERLRAGGVEVGREELETAFAQNSREFERRWVANDGQHTSADSTDMISSVLGLSPDGMRADLIGVFRRVGETARLEPSAGVEECLRTLKAAGIKLGIVCDVGLTPSPTLRFQLERYGLLGFFDAWAFSDETGWFKPAREAFEPAIRSLGVEDPSRVAHVGDSRRTDVAGAIALGMTAVRYRGFRDDRPEHGPEAHHVVRHLAALPALLRIG